MPKGFNEEDRNRINSRLIQAGKKLINTAGLRAIVIDDVVREAGISKGSFYSFYPSREDFILSILESWETEHRERLFDSMLNFKGSAKEALEHFFLGLIEMLEQEPGLARLSFTEIDRIIERLPQERMTQHEANDTRVMKEAFTAWIERGIIKPEAIEALKGIPVALFTLAMHREDFPEGTYKATIHRIVSALAENLAAESVD